MFLQSWAQLAEHEEETACGGGCSSSACLWDPNTCFSDCKPQKKWKPAFFEYIFHNILRLQRAAKQKGQGILVFSSYFQTENWSCCCDCRACKVGFPWLAQTATAVQPRWYGTRAAVEAYAKLDVALLMNARFWSPTRVTGSRSWGYQSHLQ